MFLFEFDCVYCVVLCCVVFVFDKLEFFGLDKVVGEVCFNLSGVNCCCIFYDRDNVGFSGCVIYICYGVG